MVTARKRFQTGSEIMRAYVPDYVPPTLPLQDQQQLGERSGNDVVQTLLREFTKRLSKKKLQTMAAPRGP